MSAAPDVTGPDGLIPAWLLSKTFSIQYNPECSLPWLVRLPAIGHAVLGTGNSNEDLLGFGQTCEQAASSAKACLASAEKCWQERQAAETLRRAWWQKRAVAMMAE